MRTIKSGLKQCTLNQLYCSYLCFMLTLCLSKQTTNFFCRVSIPYLFPDKTCTAVPNMPYFSHHRFEFAKGSVREQSSG